MGSLAQAYDLKDETQAKKYLDNLGIEYRFQCYKEKLPDGCHRLADFLEAFRGQHEMAKTVYKDNCDQNKYGQSCFKYGNYCFLGRAMEKNLTEAAEYYEKACEGNYYAGCYNVALLHQGGKLNKTKNYREAAKFFEKGCEGNDTACCQHLSSYYINGKPPQIFRDMSKAFTYAKKACDLGQMYACANLCQMYERGEGTKQDTEQAEFYKQKAKQLYKDVTQGHDAMKFGQTS